MNAHGDPTALIAEDEPLLARALEAELAAAWPQLNIVARAGDGAEALALALAERPDICFFDIQMPGMTGLSAARALVEDWSGPQPFPLIVFVTAYDRYAVEAFDRQAVDYLLKPVEPARLAQCVKRLQDRLVPARAATDPDRAAQALRGAVDQLRSLLLEPGAARAPAPLLDVIQAGVGNTVYMVPIDEVIYFEAADKYVRVLTAERELLVRIALKDLVAQLDPQRFWQVHRGTVVQARCILSAQRQESGIVLLTLRGRAEKITASRLYAHLFRGM